MCTLPIRRKHKRVRVSNARKEKENKKRNGIKWIESVVWLTERLNDNSTTHLCIHTNIFICCGIAVRAKSCKKNKIK